MSDQNIFGNSQNTDTNPNNQGGSNTPNTHQTNQLDTMLSMIKNESGEQKYKTVEDALKALSHSQAFIPSLKSELETTKNQLAQYQAQAAKIEELERTISQLTQNNQKSNEPSTTVSEEMIAKMVSDSLNKVTSEAKQKENLISVVNKVKELHGDKASEVFYGKATELGFSADEINTLAAKNPTAVFKMLGIEGASNKPTTLTQSSINTTALPVNTGETIGRNQKSVLLGASTQDVIQESRAARQMVEELHKQGKSVHDLTDPKVYFKHFTN